MEAYFAGREHYVFDGYVGADPRYRLPLRVVNEFAWQNLFVHQLFLRPTAEELKRVAAGIRTAVRPRVFG